MRSAAVITVSDRAATGEREYRSGPVAVAALREAGWSCGDAVVVPDGADPVEAALRAAMAGGARLVVTSGGTGVGPRDRTPEGTARVLSRALPGIAEAIRRDGAAETPTAVLSRGLAGVNDAHAALVVNLPGSPAGVAAGIRVLLGVAAHVLEQLDGADHR